MIREKNENKETKCAFGISPASRWAPTVTACSSAPERAAEGGMEGSCYNYYSYSDLYDHRYFDVWGGKDKSRIIGLMEDPEFGFLPILLRLQEGRPIRGLDYKIPEE